MADLRIPGWRDAQLEPPPTGCPVLGARTQHGGVAVDFVVFDVFLGWRHGLTHARLPAPPTAWHPLPPAPNEPQWQPATPASALVEDTTPVNPKLRNL